MDFAFDGMEKDTMRFPHDKQSGYIRKIDSVVAGKAASYIRQNAPDVSWVYLEFSDDMDTAMVMVIFCIKLFLLRTD